MDSERTTDYQIGQALLNRTSMNLLSSLSYSSSSVGLDPTYISEPWSPMTLSPVYHCSFLLTTADQEHPTRAAVLEMLRPGRLAVTILPSSNVLKSSCSPIFPDSNINFVVVHDQIMFMTDTSLSLPDTPVTDESTEKMVKELSKGIILVGDRLNKDKTFNSIIRKLAIHADKKTFSLLVENVFSDGQINWGRIFILFYAVGRLAVLMLQANLPTLVLDNVNLCLDFFKAKLLAWIQKMGGWISSISALAQFSLDSFSSSSICCIPVSAELVVVFMSGILLGSLIVWKLNKST